jgi:hypothetical protein
MAVLAHQEPIPIPTHPRRLDDWLREIWTFEAETVETLRGPESQWFRYIKTNHMVGDCDDAALVAAAMLVSPFAVTMGPGGSVEFVAARPHNVENFSHVFLETRDREGIIRIDPTAPPDADYTGWEFLRQRVR